MLKNIKTSDEVKKEIVDNNLTILRLQRNFLLKETDWWASSDLTMTDAQKKYRQDLRDITKTFKSIDDKDFKFPTKPTE
tara:strand:+ start:750 stop:986 length:237 start_codon:yes stop_codon:yes gene_type:complete